MYLNKNTNLCYVVALAVLLLALSACGGKPVNPAMDSNAESGQQTAEGGELAAAIPFPGAEQDLLELPSPQREVSGQIVNYTFDPLSPVAASANALPQGSEMVITSSGGQIEYLLYRASAAGAEPVELKVTAIPAGSNTWFGLADYDKGRFEFQRLSDVAGNLINVEDERWKSPSGNIYFALVAFDGTQIRSTGFQIRVHHGDPLVHEVVTTSGYQSCSIITLDGRPGIFYYQGNDDSLYFAHATSSAPASSSDWVFSLVDGADFPGLQQSACVFQGRPLIAYCTNGTGELRLAWSESSSPDGPENWQRISIEDGSWPAGHSSIDVVDGQPMISYYVNDDADSNFDGITGYVRLAYHLGTELAAGWLSYTLAPSGGQSSEPSLEVVTGRPAIAYVNTKSGKLRYLAADRAFPNSTAHWDSFETGRSAMPGRLRLVEAAGRPALLYPRPASLSAAYMWGLSERPEDAAGWMENFNAGTLIGLGTNFDLLAGDDRVDIFGQYQVSFQDGNGDPTHNQFAYIKRLFGTSFVEFQDYALYVEFQSGKYIGAGYCATWLGDQPAVAYLNTDGSRLMFGRVVY